MHLSSDLAGVAVALAQAGTVLVVASTQTGMPGPDRRRVDIAIVSKRLGHSTYTITADKRSRVVSRVVRTLGLFSGPQGSILDRWQSPPSASFADWFRTDLGWTVVSDRDERVAVVDAGHARRIGRTPDSSARPVRTLAGRHTVAVRVEFTSTDEVRARSAIPNAR